MPKTKEYMRKYRAKAQGKAEDYSRGAAIAQALGVDEKTAAEMYDAVNRWADGSSGIKNAQRGSGSYTEQNAKDAEILEEFISKSPAYTGSLVRVINVPEGTEFRKNGTIKSDGSITSWTTPDNVTNALHGFGRESGMNVILHVEATHGADTRGISHLSQQDGEILQAGGYDGTLTVARTKKETMRTWAYPEGMDVLHVYLRE